ncbi:hypothetical protein SUGI_0403230 [Cryptomeria japonica]|nr:hypothetical protein SUGI_0403230 [Cryptomeria japonica]
MKQMCGGEWEINRVHRTPRSTTFPAEYTRLGDGKRGEGGKWEMRAWGLSNIAPFLFSHSIVVQLWREG